ncbi:MAG: hypothetical protein ABIL70_01930 [candidate division WOR-3 bacterium]
MIKTQPINYYIGCFVFNCVILSSPSPKQSSRFLLDEEFRNIER